MKEAKQSKLTVNDVAILCKRLWIAALKDAIENAREYILLKREGAYKPNTQKHHDFKSDKLWVFRDNAKFNGFLNVCHICGVSAKKVRDYLEQVAKPIEGAV